MKNYINSSIGRLRLLAFLEGISLLILVILGVPLKYLWEIHVVVKVVGPIHGLLFILYVINGLAVAVAEKWPFFKVTVPLLLASFIPLGTFFADHKLLKPLHLRVLAAAQPT